MSYRRAILDVDTGHDDAVAIMMAARDPALALEGITVTAGNQTLPKTLQNTLNLCSALDIAAPVYGGMTRPLMAELEPAARIHGESGFDGPVFDSCGKKAEKEHAVNFLVDAVMGAASGEITLIAVAPLTNIAMAMRLEPAFAGRLGELIIMGGSMGRGNVTPSAEFNIHADPEAASIVFNSGANITMIGLDVTTTVVLDDARLNALKGIPGSAAKIFAASMEHYSAACKAYTGECPAMHDPCCVAYASDPSIIAARRAAVDIELSGAYTRGRTVVDLVGSSGKKQNALVALSIDNARFWARLEDALGRYRDRD
ncbi:MAG TPA: nucleoside hydrolase [Treponemataceae bacterium]|nr:nucleoside hydrolase [Treponemataceae bacterium]